MIVKYTMPKPPFLNGRGMKRCDFYFYNGHRSDHHLKFKPRKKVGRPQYALLKVGFSHNSAKHRCWTFSGVKQKKNLTLGREGNGGGVRVGVAQGHCLLQVGQRVEGGVRALLYEHAVDVRDRRHSYLDSDSFGKTQLHETRARSRHEQQGTAASSGLRAKSGKRTGAKSPFVLQT